MTKEGHWTQGKAFVVDSETLKTFNAVKKFFECKLCGAEFKEGDALPGFLELDEAENTLRYIRRKNAPNSYRLVELTITTSEKVLNV